MNKLVASAGVVAVLCGALSGCGKAGSGPADAGSQPPAVKEPQTSTNAAPSQPGTQAPVEMARTSVGPQEGAPVKPGVAFQGGDGTTIQNAVVVMAPNEDSGVAAEYAWISKNHPGWEPSQQALKMLNDKKYDEIVCKTPDGKTESVFFDITNFFGKF